MYVRVKLLRRAQEDIRRRLPQEAVVVVRHLLEREPAREVDLPEIKLDILDRRRGRDPEFHTRDLQLVQKLRQSVPQPVDVRVRSADLPVGRLLLLDEPLHLLIAEPLPEEAPDRHIRMNPVDVAVELLLREVPPDMPLHKQTPGLVMVNLIIHHRPIIIENHRLRIFHHLYTSYNSTLAVLLSLHSTFRSPMLPSSTSSLRGSLWGLTLLNFYKVPHRPIFAFTFSGTSMIPKR